MNAYQVTDHEFRSFSQLIHGIAGITLTDAKKALVTGRLTKRLNALGMDTFTQYFKYVTSAQHQDELQYMVDLLTTNETYFFREPQHFKFLRETILPLARNGQTFRVWSAAASNGAEAYSIAMLLADVLKGNVAWEIFGSDISQTMLERARHGLYRMDDAAKIPTDYLKKYCLKGVRDQEGSFLVDSSLRRRVRFENLNLIDENMRKPGEFDVIFLRNVLIYFDMPNKKRVIENLVPCMKKGGHLIIGHAETLSGVTDALRQVRPTIYTRG